MTNVVKLRDKLEEYETVLGQRGIIWPFTFTSQEDKMFGLLMKRELVSKDMFDSVLYSDISIDRRPNASSQSLVLMRIRKKLSHSNVVIVTRKGEGWYISAADKKKVYDMVEANKALSTQIEHAIANPNVKVGAIIEKGIPIPPRNLLQRKYHFDKMDVGDSFFAPTSRELLRKAASKFQQNHASEMQFEIRKVRENRMNGARCWRIK